MLKQLFNRMVGTRFERELKRIQPLIDQIHEYENGFASCSDSEIQAQTEKLRGIIKRRVGELEAELEARRAEKHACADPVKRDVLDDEVHELEERLKRDLSLIVGELLPEAFATVREACRRLLNTKVVVTGHEMDWDMVPYDVQLIGGVVLHEGKIAEMATGEGKTLVATLPIYLRKLPLQIQTSLISTGWLVSKLPGKHADQKPFCAATWIRFIADRIKAMRKCFLNRLSSLSNSEGSVSFSPAVVK